VSASAPAAASQAPCVPDALAADLTSPVWQPPPLRVERLPPIPLTWSLSRTLSPSSSISRVTNSYRIFWGGDTSPRVELPRPDTGGAISPTPPDTQTPHITTGSTLPPRAFARHTCIAPSGERLTSTHPA